MTRIPSRAIREWWAARQMRKFHEGCERMGIPHEVRARLWKAGLRSAPDWYAGRTTK